eukprot:COSAG01_NODE_3533_length_5962_cov_41.705611_2_plen_94_part_00
MRCPPASVLGDAADGAIAPPTPPASRGAPSPLAGAKKSLGGPEGPSKSYSRTVVALPSRTVRWSSSVVRYSALVDGAVGTYRELLESDTGCRE